ncbi:hypothetical protein D0A37_00600 [Microcoleus vaginatus HSN003]|nr:hypothetical protein D0A37_00600 [Microcoleus vaginatus HSN003]
MFCYIVVIFPADLLISTNIEQITCFINFQAIEFYGFDHLLTNVVNVGFGPGAIAQQDERLLSVYAITALAVAIVANVSSTL